MTNFSRPVTSEVGICGRWNAKFWSETWLLVGKTRWSLNSMTNNSKNRREGFKVVVQDRWSLNSSGRYDDFDCK